MAIHVSDRTGRVRRRLTATTNQQLARPYLGHESAGRWPSSLACCAGPARFSQSSPWSRSSRARLARNSAGRSLCRYREADRPHLPLLVWVRPLVSTQLTPTNYGAGVKSHLLSLGGVSYTTSAWAFARPDRNRRGWLEFSANRASARRLRSRRSRSSRSGPTGRFVGYARRRDGVADVGLVPTGSYVRRRLRTNQMHQPDAPAARHPRTISAMIRPPIA